MANAAKPVIGIIMGSTSDMPTMEACMAQLDEFGVPYEVKIASAHRKPAEVHDWALTSAASRSSSQPPVRQRISVVAEPRTRHAPLSACR